MAIAYVGSGAVQKIEVAHEGSAHSIPLPAGHASGHTLLLWSLTDDTSGTVFTPLPAGWFKLGEWAPGTTSGFLVYPRLEIFWRVDTGSLGSDVSVQYSTAGWPAGDASVMAWTSAYSGCDTAGPVATWQASNTTSTAATQAHPVLTTVSADNWLLSFRSAYSTTARTFTVSGGTNAERVDDNYFGLHGALYDSNAALPAGVQTQRSTTASGTCAGGGTMVSIALKPAAVPAAAFAGAGTAEVSVTAHDASVTAQDGPWDLCAPEGTPTYVFAVDWEQTGLETVDGEEDITGDIVSEVTATYGRDQDRQLSPAAVGSAALEVVNASRKYSPENPDSPLAGDLDPARDAKFEVTWGGNTYPIFRGRIDDFDVKVDRSDRTVSFSFLDGMNVLQGVQLSTAVYPALRTGELVHQILDLAGWTAGRDIDPGATVVPYWWEEGTDALEAVQKLVRSEGPPAIAYVAPDGSFVFRDRHHRLLRDRSLTVQATYRARKVDCAHPPGRDFFTGATAEADGDAVTLTYLVADNADAAGISLGDTFRLYTGGGALKEDTVFTVTDLQSAFGFTNIFFSPDAAVGTVTGDQLRVGNFVTPGFDFTKPFVYSHGWRDIVNSVSFDVSELTPDTAHSEVWTHDGTVGLSIGQSLEIQASASDPFTDALTPVAGVDYTVAGAGVLSIQLSRTSGQSAKISLLAVGGDVTVTGLRLRARPLTVRRTTKVQAQDTGSISAHGERAYPEDAPWASAHDARAIANMVLLHYARRRPTVSMRVVTQDPAHFMQVIRRTLGDRIRIRNEEMGLDAGFFIERVTHTVQRMNRSGAPPVHAVVFACEKELDLTANPFTFDLRGAGFDDGVFDPITADDPETVFIFDDPARGRFDAGLFGT